MRIAAGIVGVECNYNEKRDWSSVKSLNNFAVKILEMGSIFIHKLLHFTATRCKIGDANFYMKVRKINMRKDSKLTIYI